MTMESFSTYVYFALTGDDFDPQQLTHRIGIEPTESWIKGDKGKFKPKLNYSCWKLSTKEGNEYFVIYRLIEEIVAILYDKIDIINEVKTQYKLEPILEIVLDIDINPEISTPAMGHDLKTIEFLYKTNTRTDIDIYRFDSRK